MGGGPGIELLGRRGIVNLFSMVRTLDLEGQLSAEDIRDARLINDYGQWLGGSEESQFLANTFRSLKQRNFR